MNLFKKKYKIKIDQTKLLTKEEIQDVCITVIRNNKRSPYRKKLKMIMEKIPKSQHSIIYDCMKKMIEK